MCRHNYYCVITESEVGVERSIITRVHIYIYNIYKYIYIYIYIHMYIGKSGNSITTKGLYIKLACIKNYTTIDHLSGINRSIRYHE